MSPSKSGGDTITTCGYHKVLSLDLFSMKKTKSAPISDVTKVEALKVAKGIQKPGQTKEQTKLIAQGIEKGIAEYKKREKQKARERDKQRKQELKAKEKAEAQPISEEKGSNPVLLPWVLLGLSWVGFIAYISAY